MAKKAFTQSCKCAGGLKYCGYIRIYNFGDNDLDIAVFDKQDKKWHGVYFDEKAVKKLKAWLKTNPSNYRNFKK